jgi:hypothetical protein
VLQDLGLVLEENRIFLPAGRLEFGKLSGIVWKMKEDVCILAVALQEPLEEIDEVLLEAADVSLQQKAVYADAHLVMSAAPA